jgi:hypothetical protein
MSARPVNALLAIVSSLLPVPSMKLLDQINRGCGDGMCGFIPGLMIFFVLGAATLIFISRSARRGETPAALRFVPLALWALGIVPMVL